MEAPVAVPPDRATGPHLRTAGAPPVAGAGVGRSAAAGAVPAGAPGHMSPRLHDAATEDVLGAPLSTQHSHPAAHAGRSDHAKHIYHVPECGIGIASQSDTDDSTTGPFRPFRDQKRQTSACGNQSQGHTIFHGRFLQMYPGSFKGKWPGRSFTTTLT